MTELLSLKQVSKYFGQRCILKDVTVQVKAGTITILMGANGAGKSTLLRLMAGLSTPSMGEVDLHVEEKEVGYLGHATFVYPALTARENLAFWGQMYGLPSAQRDDAALEAVLSTVELLPFADERARVFSRGMAQRLNLARVLLLRPKLWLFDEPSTGLDVRSAAMLRAEVQRAKEEGAAIVWISHDAHNDAAMADALWHIEKGRVNVSPRAEMTC